MLENFLNIFHKNQIKQYYTVDIHSHLIPGIDDGSKSMEESLSLIKKLKDLGFQKLIITPHIMSDRFPNTAQGILSGLEKLRSELLSKSIDIKLEAASEYFLDQHFLNLLKKREILTFGDVYLLFELSYTNKPLILESAIFEMIVAGYKPVLAHPERYLFLHQNFEEYKWLKRKGLLFQVNLNSFSGYYSKAVQKVANRLAEEGLIDFIGSDTHKERQLVHLEKNLHSKVIMEKIFKNNTILNESLL
jgi:tyrosine-protein phosphatase YwqE